ncbi:hypothetical protein A2U01_0052948, partial [Trifolium medium]|nr:hypothetical protein [Trifolium medium]
SAFTMTGRFRSSSKYSYLRFLGSGLSSSEGCLGPGVGLGASGGSSLKLSST